MAVSPLRLSRGSSACSCANLINLHRREDEYDGLPELKAMVSLALERVMDFCQADRGALVLLDAGGRERYSVRQDCMGKELGAVDLAMSDYLLSAVLKKQGPVWLDPGDDVLVGKDAWAVCIPMRSRDRVFSILYLETGAASSEFRPRCCHFIERYLALISAGTHQICERIHYFVPELDGESPSADHLDCSNIFRKPGATFESIVGRHPKLTAVLKIIARVAESDAPVLIQGETGTGKELIAEALHANSKRRDGCFLPLNCAALPESILESELFGYHRGAFTGAVKDKMGLLEQANSGTLFLDEIADMPAGIQVKLLRVLQTRDYVPLGATKQRRFDGRVVSATSRDLPALIASGEFRLELFHRLNVIEVTVPPLRERKSDIPELARHFTAVYANRYGKPYLSITEKGIEALQGLDFPGNVREMESIIHRAVVLAEGRVVDACDLTLPDDNAFEAQVPEDLGQNPRSFREGKRRIIEEFEREFIAHALKNARGNISGAARQSCINVKNFYVKMRRYGIDPLHFRA